MYIRKIKANIAMEEGDYIRIEQYSTRFTFMLVGAIIGVVLGIAYVMSLTDVSNEPTIITISTLFFAVLGLILSQGKEVRRVPKADLVEIKEYDNEHVTVVLDDERVKNKFRKNDHEK